jgi:hypothetical protein
MTTVADPRRGFWQLVGRPFRAVGHGIARVWDFLDFVSLILSVARGIAWVFRRLGRAISDWFRQVQAVAFYPPL